jgi:2-oxoglutarate/2-oxoacid ferredoxin oxidoreductase subunit beta
VNMSAQDLSPRDYKSDLKPVWCPGCGHFAVLNALTKALASLSLPREEVALVSGIGCSSRLPAYTSVYGFHGIHGRATAVAAGIKVARPELTVLVVGGDGDGFSIGGNHFLHACRRNIDFTYIVMDNEVYGMTKGQASPTSPEGWSSSKLTPHGTGMRTFQPAAIALAAGASFIARGFCGDPNGLARMIVDAIRHPGFSFVQALSPCPTFVPEQTGWKKRVHPEFTEPTSDYAEAVRRVHEFDGFSTGVMFAQERTVWPPEISGTDKRTVDEIGREFVL